MAYARRLGLSKAEQARFKGERRERDREHRLWWNAEGPNIMARVRNSRREEAERIRQAGEARKAAVETARELKEAAKRTIHNQRMLAIEDARRAAGSLLLEERHIVARLNPDCYWCGLPFDAANPNMARSREHLIPRSLGGRDGHNIVAAHKICNNRRRSDLTWIPFSEHGRLGEIVTEKPALATG